jgi:hypothetical protein
MRAESILSSALRRAPSSVAVRILDESRAGHVAGSSSRQAVRAERDVLLAAAVLAAHAQISSFEAILPWRENGTSG